MEAKIGKPAEELTLESLRVILSTHSGAMILRSAQLRAKGVSTHA